MRLIAYLGVEINFDFAPCPLPLHAHANAAERSTEHFASQCEYTTVTWIGISLAWIWTGTKSHQSTAYFAETKSPEKSRD